MSTTTPIDNALYTFKLPDIGEGVAEGEITAWLVEEGQPVAEDAPLVEVMTDKVTVEIPAPKGGVVQKHYGAVGDVIEVGAPLVDIALGDASAATLPKAPQPEPMPALEKETHAAAPVAPLEAARPPKESSPASVNVTAPEATKGKVVLAAPATRQLAKRLDVPICQIQGSGPHGRIRPEDVEAYAQRGPAKAAINVAPSLVQAKVPQAARAPYSGMRKRIGERLLQSVQSIPSFAYVEEIRMDRVMEMRTELKPRLAEEGLKLSPLAFVARAVSLALLEYPSLNARLSEDGQHIQQADTINLGIAADTPGGLVVPVIHAAHGKGLLALAQEIQALGEKARAQTLNVSDLQGATFTLSSIGSIGGLLGIPIINPPECAIMGINTIRKVPIVNERNEIVVGQVMNLSLSADHRIVDGADAARFMNHIKSLLESPSQLCLL